MIKNELKGTSIAESQYPSLKGYDYLELYVGNALHAAHFYCKTFGFNIVGYAGLETGVKDRISYVIKQNQIILVLTSPLNTDSSVARHVDQHGDGVKDIAFTVNDAVQAFQQTTRMGACPVLEPVELKDQYGTVIKATIQAFGDTTHTFVQRNRYSGMFLPGFQLFESPFRSEFQGLVSIDHLAIVVEGGKLNELTQFYQQVLGFQQTHTEDVSTEYSAMNSKVVENSTGRIKFPIMEPSKGLRTSQIEEYLSFYSGPGVQHIALQTDDIVSTVRSIRKNGIGFRKTPNTYYEMLEGRVGEILEEMDEIREQHILVDRDELGYLLQIFSQPLQSRPTVFFEIIQRKGACGFGSGNIKALYESIEREQAQRAAW